MYKVVLSAIDESKYLKSIINASKLFAEEYQSTILAQYVINLISLEGSFFHDVSGALGMEPLANLTKKMKDLLNKKGETLLNEFGSELDKYNIKYEKFIDTGIIANKIVERAKIADLIIIGKRGINEKFDKNSIGSTTEGVLKKTSTNVLVVPDDFSSFSKPFLAYDGSKISKKAMEGAAHLCEKFNLPLTVVTINEKNKGEKIIGEAELYLRAYKIDKNFIVLEGSPHSEILRFIESEKMDFGFMGTVSHHFFIDMILGSTANYILRKSNIPIIFFK